MKQQCSDRLLLKVEVLSRCQNHLAYQELVALQLMKNIQMHQCCTQEVEVHSSEQDTDETFLAPKILHPVQIQISPQYQMANTPSYINMKPKHQKDILINFIQPGGL